MVEKKGDDKKKPEMCNVRVYSLSPGGLLMGTMLAVQERYEIDGDDALALVGPVGSTLYESKKEVRESDILKGFDDCDERYHKLIGDNEVEEPVEKHLIRKKYMTDTLLRLNRAGLAEGRQEEGEWLHKLTERGIEIYDVIFEEAEKVDDGSGAVRESLDKIGASGEKAEAG